MRTLSLIIVSLALALVTSCSSAGNLSGSRNVGGYASSGGYVPAGGDSPGYSMGYPESGKAAHIRARSTAGLRRPRPLRGLRGPRVPRYMRGKPAPSYGSQHGNGIGAPGASAPVFSGGVNIPFNNPRQFQGSATILLAPGTIPTAPLPHTVSGWNQQQVRSYGGVYYDPVTDSFIWN